VAVIPQDVVPARAFDLAETTATVGAPSLRFLQGRVPQLPVPCAFDAAAYTNGVPAVRGLIPTIPSENDSGPYAAA
jgi:hypothetical protein